MRGITLNNTINGACVYILEDLFIWWPILELIVELNGLELEGWTWGYY